MITEKIARFIAGITPDKIPSDAFEVARRGILDFCGVALAGSKEEAGDIIAGFVQDTGGAAHSGVIGKGFRTSPHLAALANGTIGQALDYDDLSFTYGAHPSVTLSPVVLALGESLGASGKEILAAYVIGFKPYPSCGGTLGVTDAALYLRKKYSTDVSLIEEIVLGVGPFENRSLIHRPGKGLEGKFSLEYCACRVLLDGKLTLRDFSDERVNEPEIQRLISRVKCEERYPMAVMGADSSGLNPQSVTIRMKDGREYFRETPLNSGMPVSSMNDAQLEMKYCDCASLALDGKKVEQSLSMLGKLAALPDIRGLMKIISGRASSAV